MNGFILAFIMLVFIALSLWLAVWLHNVKHSPERKVARALQSARTHLLDMQAHSEYYAAMADMYRKQITRLQKEAVRVGVKA